MITRPPQIGDSHLERGALVYIRQSSPAQVLKNTGSTALQRNLANMLISWGWPAERVEIRDEDLGKSGSAPNQRSGFINLLEEMKDGKWGLVAVVDISRLFRNDLDYALFASIAYDYNVLLTHGSNIVDFRDANSAFVAGVLGLNAGRENRSRIEQSRQAKREKAKKGQAVSTWSIGYVKGPNMTWVKDPDPRVRDVIQLVFDKFRELGSAGAVWRYFVRHGIKLPRRFRGEDQP